MSLAVVGADYPNKGKSPARRFEIAICRPGERVELVPEPKNAADENAIAVFSVRGIQIGYLTAERGPLIKTIMARGEEARAIFQAGARYGAVIRVAFGGQEPALPEVGSVPPSDSAPDDSDFWPDPIWPDD